MLSTVRWSSGGSGERRLGVGAIPAKEGRDWTGSGRGASGGGGEAVGRGDLDWVEGSRRIPARKVRRRLGVGGRGEDERGNSTKEELGSVL
jgi:hypothetical protein